MKRICDYKLLEGSSEKVLSEKVRESICEGWQPYGSPSVAKGNTNVVFIQAVVKYED